MQHEFPKFSVCFDFCSLSGVHGQSFFIPIFAKADSKWDSRFGPIGDRTRDRTEQRDQHPRAWSILRRLLGGSLVSIVDSLRSIGYNQPHSLLAPSSDSAPAPFWPPIESCPLSLLALQKGEGWRSRGEGFFHGATPSHHLISSGTFITRNAMP